MVAQLTFGTFLLRNLWLLVLLIGVLLPRSYTTLATFLIPLGIGMGIGGWLPKDK